MRVLLPFLLLFCFGFCEEQLEELSIEKTRNGANLYEQNNPYGGYQREPWPSNHEKKRSKKKEEKQEERDYTDFEEEK